MRTKCLIAALLLMVASLQTASAQGFRVYKSDGTFTQFSFRTDSIVFYEGAGEEVDFGLFTPVNQIVVGKWYKNQNETVNFNEDGTTDYYPNGTYEYIPYQSEILVYNSSKALQSILKVHKVTAEQMVVSTLGSTSFSVWTSTQPPQLVEQIELDETELILDVNEMVSLTASVLPEDADNPAVIWVSSNEAVAGIYTHDNICYVLAVAAGTCIITCCATDGSGVKVECQVMVVIPEEHEYVDLGLPSGTLWATCNVGANSPEEYGDYFAWGETEPKEDYSSDTYKFYDTTYKIYTKYWLNSEEGIIDNKTELEPKDDAATVNWGRGWQMPSSDQISELINRNYTNTTWTTLNGVNGVMIVSMSNGNSIFLPAAGDLYGTSLKHADTGQYWSRSLYPYDSRYGRDLYFDSSTAYRDYYYRYHGRSVRPVRVQTQ